MKRGAAFERDAERVDQRSSSLYCPKCPRCQSDRVCKGGLRYLKDGRAVQRFECSSCGYRFSETTLYNSEPIQTDQIDHLNQPDYNTRMPSMRPGRLDEELGQSGSILSASRTEKWAAGATVTDHKSLLFQYSWYLKKQGYAESTIKSRHKLLKTMAKRGADLRDVESVKETIAKQEWSNGRKANAVDAYTSFLLMTGGKWNPPRYRRVHKLPFIPTETEIDQLIAGCGRTTATLLQLLKETGMRIGEAWKLQWTDVDFVNRTVRVTPEKGSNPRIFKLTNKLLAMLEDRKRKTGDKRVFGKSLKTQRRLFEKQRRRLASKLGNPRILNITYHTFRHFKATMEYHRTKDPIHVMRILGHKNINNTLVYTHLMDFQDDEYTSKVARTVEEACELIDAGFEYVTGEYNDGGKIFRKRK